MLCSSLIGAEANVCKGGEEGGGGLMGSTETLRGGKLNPSWVGDSLTSHTLARALGTFAPLHLAQHCLLNSRLCASAHILKCYILGWM